MGWWSWPWSRVEPSCCCGPFKAVLVSPCVWLQWDGGLPCVSQSKADSSKIVLGLETVSSICPFVWINKKCDKLTWSGDLYKICNIVYPRPALCTSQCSQLCTSVCAQRNPPGGHIISTNSDVPPGTLSPEIPFYNLPVIHQFCLLAIHNAHQPVPSVTKTLHLTNVSTWQIEATEAKYVKTDQMEQNSENQCSDTIVVLWTMISYFKLLL